LKTAVTELPDSRVRVEVEVPADLVGRGLQRAARALAREMRMPGFRKGKAPPSLVIQRLGFGTVLQDAIRESLPEWYERGLLSSGISPVGDPNIEIVSAPEGEGEPLEFKFEIGVRPPAKLGEYKGLEVGKAEAEPTDEIVDREVERIREGFTKLEPVERAAADGDVLLVDFEGLRDGKAFEGGKANDYLLELGGGQLIEGFEEQLSGAEAGEERKVEVTFPEDYQAEELAGEDAVFKVEVKEVREKVLPELDDDFASEASEFETLEELRADIAKRVSEAVDERAEQDFRVAAVDAAVDAATVEMSWRRSRQLRSPRRKWSRPSPTLPSTSAPRRRSCSSACARTAATRWSARTSPCARQSTSSPSRPNRFRSSRPRRARKSGRRRKRKRRNPPSSGLRTPRPAGSALQTLNPVRCLPG
jgi:trigger factor